MVNKLITRNLFKRAIAICRDTVENYDDCKQAVLEKINESSLENYKLRNEIHGSLSSQCSVHEVWVSIPEAPSLREAAQTYVVTFGKAEFLNVMFPVDGWLKAYADKQMKGYVFGPADIQKLLCKASGKVFNDKGFRFKANKHRIYCHI